MKHLVILGAGTGGTTVANRLRRKLPDDWVLSIVDPSPTHLYQPGLLFLPFGARDEAAMRRPRRRTLKSGIHWVESRVDRLDTEGRTVHLSTGDALPYDLLVLASGAEIRPDLTPGVLGPGWRTTVHDFYTLEGAQALRSALAGFEGGRLVVDIVEMPIKCPVAPLEFAFLADDYFRRRGLRSKVELVYATPLDKAFTRPLAAKVLGQTLVEKGIQVEAEFALGEVDAERRVATSYDGREIPYDLLVTIPTHAGAEFVSASGLGNELGFIHTDKETLQVIGQERIFALGDATDLPSSKAGSVAHFQAEVLEENLLHAIRGEALEKGFDGHANCFVETGHGRAMLIDFNYETDPMPGTYPVPGVGPFRLLEETRLNHLGKLAFRPLYWNGLLPGHPLPVPTRMSMAGKRPPAPQQATA
jgi:sulfide:quinone oxidoreductase